MNFCMDQIDAAEIGILARSGHDTTEVPELVPLMLSDPDQCKPQLVLHFPMLESLALGKHCLGCRDAIDWIVHQRVFVHQDYTLVSFYHTSEPKNFPSRLSLRMHDWNQMPENIENGTEVNDEMFHYAGSWAEMFAAKQNWLGHLMAVEIPFEEDVYRRFGQEMQDSLDGIGSQETQSLPCDIEPHGPDWMIGAEDTTDLIVETMALD